LFTEVANDVEYMKSRRAVFVVCLQQAGMPSTLSVLVVRVVAVSLDAPVKVVVALHVIDLTQPLR
jgi:hypothetical protein